MKKRNSFHNNKKDIKEQENETLAYCEKLYNDSNNNNIVQINNSLNNIHDGGFVLIHKFVLNNEYICNIYKNLVCLPSRAS